VSFIKSAISASWLAKRWEASHEFVEAQKFRCFRPSFVHAFASISGNAPSLSD
jgi:hypothetical protein